MESPTVITIDVPVNIYNPDGKVSVRNLYYRIYINGEYVGDGFKPYLDLPSGNTTTVFNLKIDLLSLGCGVSDALLNQENITIRVEGYLQFDIKAFGIIPWKTIAIPFNTTAKQYKTPEIPQQALAPLHLKTLICEHPDTITQILQTLQTGNAAPGGGGGGWGFPSPGG
ncbi:MAG: LEA type 2 family protein [Desulfurococcales archaeon]|nr:LEA type 2 family protein [Desulfurococcales archaeon]